MFSLTLNSIFYMCQYKHPLPPIYPLIYHVIFSSIYIPQYEPMWYGISPPVKPSCQWLFGPTLTCVVDGALMELTPLSRVLLWICSVFLCLWPWWVVLGHLALAFSFVLRFGGTFPLLQIHRSKVSLVLFKLLLDLNGVSVRRSEWGDVQEIHLVLDVYM